MKTFYGPKSPAFLSGPTRIFGYDEILAPTVVHGPDLPAASVSENLPTINHFIIPIDERAIAPPLIIPDDSTTSHGKLIHYNRVWMIAASIISHHARDGSFSKVARDKVYHDFNLILNWTDDMVIFVASPHEYTPGPIAYPPILEADGLIHMQINLILLIKIILVLLLVVELASIVASNQFMGPRLSWIIWWITGMSVTKFVLVWKIFWIRIRNRVMLI
jgi:hypothetical protein